MTSFLLGHKHPGLGCSYTRISEAIHTYSVCMSQEMGVDCILGSMPSGFLSNNQVAR